MENQYHNRLIILQGLKRVLQSDDGTILLDLKNITGMREEQISGIIEYADLERQQFIQLKSNGKGSVVGEV